MVHERTTKYTIAVKAFMERVGHATNQQILSYLQNDYPELSATTIHRITTRMVDRGELMLAPSAKDNVSRFDANLTPHDHFHCTNCDRLRDVELPTSMFDAIQEMMGDCKLNGRLTVQGSCDKCLNHTEEI